MCSVCQKPFDSEGKETLPCFHEICKKCRKDADETERKFCEICHYPYNNVVPISLIKAGDDEYFNLLQTFLSKTYPLLLEQIKKFSQIPNYEKHLENVNKSDFKDVYKPYKFRLIEVYKILIEHNNKLKITLESMKRAKKIVCSIVTNPDENHKQMLPMINDYIQWLLDKSDYLDITYSAKVFTPKSENYRPEDGDTFNKVSIVSVDDIRKINISEVTFIKNKHRTIQKLYFGVTDKNVFFSDGEALCTLYPEYELEQSVPVKEFYIQHENPVMIWY